MSKEWTACLCATVGLLTALTGTLAATEPEKGLVLHLPLDGTFEAAVGKEIGAVRAQKDPQFVEGRHGKGVSLTDDAHLIVPVPPTIKKGEFTIAFWMKPLWHPADNLPHPILEIPDDPNKVDKVGWAPGQYLLSKGWSETIAPNNLYGAVSATAKRHLRPNQWAHVVIECSVTNKFTATYFDGEGVRQPDAKTKAPVAYGNTMYLGKRASGYGTGDFVLDDLKVYDRIVPPEELAIVAGAEFPVPMDNSLLGVGCDPAKAVETPHVKWAKPLAGGPLKILCLGSADRSREFIELAQRLEMEPVVVVAPDFDAGFAANPEVGQGIGRKVEAALKAGNVQCVLVAAFGWNLLPDSTRAAIMAFVRNGGGLLLADPRCVAMGPESGKGIYHCWGNGIWYGWAANPLGQEIEKLVDRLDRADEEYLTQDIPFASLPEFSAVLSARPVTALFRGGKVEKGRILVYDLRFGAFGLTPRLPSGVLFDTFTYDYAIGAAAKAVLWAGGRDSAARIQQVAYRVPNGIGDHISTGAAGEWSVNVWNRGSQYVNGQLKLTVRTNGPEEAFEATQAVSLKPGVTRLAFKQPMSAIGTVFGDVRLLQDQKVADWASGVITVERGNPAFVEVKANAECYGDGQSPEISAEFRLVKYCVKAGEKGEIRWRLYDAFGRLVRRGTETVTFDAHDEFTAKAAWKVGALDGASLGYPLIVDLAQNNRVSDRRTLTLWRSRHDSDDFTFFSWGGYEGSCNALSALVMRDRYQMAAGHGGAGASNVELLRGQLDWMARNNLQSWLYVTHIGANLHNRPRDPGSVREPDLADPSYQRNLREYLAETAKVARAFSPLYYTLGDETSLGPPFMEASSSEQEAFRRHLQERYRTIEGLNQTWGTKYKSWEETAIPSSKVLQEGKAGPLAVELEDFREGLYAKTLGSGVEGARSVSPEAHVGVEGMFGLGNAWMGQDFWKMTRCGSLLGMYDSSVMGTSAMQYSMVRSFLKPGDLFTCWWNYEMQDPDYSRYGPWHALLHGMNAFGWFTTIGGPYSSLYADFSPYEQFLWTHGELEPLIAGVGKLVVGARRDDIGVAVLWNQYNLDRNAPTFHSTLMLNTLLDDLGIQFNYIHGEQVTGGELSARKVKVLILPGQNAMSPPVAEAIRAFVEAGGALVADVPPGVHNGFKHYEKPLLNDLLADASALKGGMPPGSKDDLAAWETHQRTCGKGRTLFFGGYPTSYGRDRLKPRGQFLRQAVQEFLAARGVKPAATVRAVDGTFQPLAMVTYHDGDARYVGMQREYTVPDQSPREFVVAAADKRHAYDVLAGKYLGETDQVKLTLLVARGAMVAFLPYQVKSIRLDGFRKAYPAGATLQLKPTLVCSGGKADRGVLRVEVTGPGGIRIAPLCRKAQYEAGQTAVELGLAFNDPKGAWKIAVTDVATGVREEQSFRVE